MPVESEPVARESSSGGRSMEFEKSILAELLKQSQETMQQSLENYQSTVMASITQFGQNIESMTSGIKQISASAEELRDSVEKQKEAVQELSESQKQIDNISKEGLERVRNLSSQIGELNDLSTALQSMLDETSDIAEQLHILSINGSIEAARAGSTHGAAFKVVSQEMSKLSENASSVIDQQADSVRNILSIISQINEVSDESVERFRQNGDNISKNVGLLESLSQEMDRVASSAEELSAVIQEFSGAIDEMKAGVQELRNSAEEFRHHLEREFAVNSFSAKLTTSLKGEAENKASLQEAAQAITDYIYGRFAEQEHLPTLLLVRIFVALPHEELSAEDLQDLSSWLPQDAPRYLCLAGTTGKEPNWNKRTQSKNHRVMPLPETAEKLKAIPMIAEMFRRMNVDYSRIVHPEQFSDAQEMTEGYMLVEQAEGSPFIPAQKEFVQSYGVASELGYGGFLPSGRAYACFLFSQDPLQVNDAEKLKMIAPALQQALVSFDAEGRIWSASRGIPEGRPRGG